MLLPEQQQGQVSCHNNKDNLNIQRSAVTTATAESDAGTCKVVLATKIMSVFKVLLPQQQQGQMQEQVSCHCNHDNINVQRSKLFLSLLRHTTVIEREIFFQVLN